MADPLTALANIISTGAGALTKAYSQNGLQFPSLDDPFQPAPLSMDSDPSLVEHKALIAAAAAQILAMVRPPFETFLELSSGMYGTATCSFVVDTNIPDILKEAGPAGLNVRDIAAKAGVDASYIARALRFLAARHIFKEVSPDVFTNNRLSLLITKAKSLEEIRADPTTRFDGARLAPLISQFGDEGLPSSVFLSSFMQDPERNTTPFNIAFKTDATLWEWYEKPGNEWRARRFGAAISRSSDGKYAEANLNKGVLAASLEDGDIIVDVGGSMGSMVLHLYQEMPQHQYRYIVQDLEKPIEAGKQFWSQVAPGALESGQVTLQVHNFFDPQPVKGAGLYVLRTVLHDWPQHSAESILKRLRDAANPSSKLIIFDFLAVHTCEASPVTSASGNKVPYPLLPCLGTAGAGFVSYMDMMMLNFFNGKERTEREFRDLGEATGWKLQSVISGVSESLSCFLYIAA